MRNASGSTPRKRIANSPVHDKRPAPGSLAAHPGEQLLALAGPSLITNPALCSRLRKSQMACGVIVCGEKRAAKRRCKLSDAHRLPQPIHQRIFFGRELKVLQRQRILDDPRRRARLVSTGVSDKSGRSRSASGRSMEEMGLDMMRLRFRSLDCGLNR